MNESLKPLFVRCERVTIEQTEAFIEFGPPEGDLERPFLAEAMVLSVRVGMVGAWRPGATYALSLTEVE